MLKRLNCYGTDLVVVVDGERGDYEVWIDDPHSTSKGHVERFEGYRARSRALDAAHANKARIEQAAAYSAACGD